MRANFGFRARDNPGARAVIRLRGFVGVSGRMINLRASNDTIRPSGSLEFHRVKYGIHAAQGPYLILSRSVHRS